MPQRRVWELARDLGLTSTSLVEALRNQGIDVTNHFSMLDEESVKFVLNLYRAQDTAVASVSPPIEQIASDTALVSDQPVATPAQLVTQPAIPGKVLRLPKIFTVKDFAEVLQVPIEDVLAQLRRMGTVASMKQVIDLDTANVVVQKLGKNVTLVTEGAEDVAKDKISGVIMSFPEEPNDTASDFPGSMSEASDTSAQEVGTYDTTQAAEGRSEAGTPEAQESDASDSDTSTGNTAEEGKKLVVIDLGRASRQQIKRLRQGHGSLIRRVGRVNTDLKAEDQFSQDRSTLVMVIERRRR